MKQKEEDMDYNIAVQYFFLKYGLFSIFILDPAQAGLSLALFSAFPHPPGQVVK